MARGVVRAASASRYTCSPDTGTGGCRRRPCPGRGDAWPRWWRGASANRRPVPASGADRFVSGTHEEKLGGGGRGGVVSVSI